MSIDVLRLSRNEVGGPDFLESYCLRRAGNSADAATHANFFMDNGQIIIHGYSVEKTAFRAGFTARA